MPLVGAEVDVQHHFAAMPLCVFGSKEGGAPRRLFAQPCATHQQKFALGDGAGQHVVDGQLDVGAVVAVVGQREFVGWLDAQYHRAGPLAIFARRVLRVNAFFFAEIKDEIPHLVVAHCRQQRRARPETLGRHADVGGAATHIGGKAGDIHKGGTHVVGI